MTTLKDVRVGESATVTRLTGTGVYVRKVAPLGDPIEITVRGYELSIRKDEAASVEVGNVAQGEVPAR